MNSTSLFTWQARTRSAHEYERPLQHAQKQRVLAMKLLIQLRAHFGDAGLQLLLCHQDLQDIPFHLAFSYQISLLCRFGI